MKGHAMRARAQQKGLTLIGFAIVLVVLGFFAYAAMKLIPAYTEYFGVVKSMKLLQTEPNIENATIEEIRKKLSLSFDIQYVDPASIPEKNVQLITANGQRKLRIAYDKDIPFLYNVDLLVHFDNSVDLTHGATY
jgi:Tfp pilus assembly major pilin PilA